MGTMTDHEHEWGEPGKNEAGDLHDYAVCQICRRVMYRTEVYAILNEHAKLEAELDKAVAFLEGDDSPLARLEAELLKYRRLDMAWAEEVKEQDLTITNLKEELGHLHSRFDRELDDALAETQEKEVTDE